MIALLDGDVFAHHCCTSRFAVPADPSLPYHEVIMMVENKEKVQFTKEQDREYLENCWQRFQKSVEKVVTELYADDYLMAIKSPLNFRDDIFPDYKMNRHKDPSKMNQFVPAIRQLAVLELDAVEAVWREADDLLRMWAEQAMLAGEEYVVVSVDKDLDCIPGNHLNPKTGEFYVVSPLQATRFFYQQLMSGDPTDNIPGLPGVGPVKAKKLLLNVSDEEEMQEIVVMQYVDLFAEHWESTLLSNGKMLYLQKHEHDFFSIADWPIAAAFRHDPLLLPFNQVEKVVEVAVPPAPAVPQPPVVQAAPPPPRFKIPGR